MIVDEWHELLSSKRGTQTELCLARLRKWNTDLKTWGLSATLGNLNTALSTLVGSHKQRSYQWRFKEEICGKDDHPQKYGKVSLGWPSGWQVSGRSRQTDRESTNYFGLYQCSFAD